ncbi:sulfotransferase [Streptomyces sp. MP131-18]|uniref:sulfotransferase family protein n=1 Tax=Streptomyces sp. MP131-18 TaxID=1857892 RepID=UPI00097C58F8|nr:sulfotransferase [Streptomyces sp. MP131-18]ONK14514.1 Sulfotransferase domain protein [Streptomyces sp. MP131-18]
MTSLTFVVGTGRSGSTALSRVLNQHPDILSLNEYLSTLGDPDVALPAHPIDGRTFLRLLAEPHFAFDAMIRDGVPMPEFLCPRPGSPALCLMVLPHLTGEPEAVLRDLAGEIAAWPARAAAVHHLALIGLLRARFGGEAVVERSGYSLRWVPRLHAAFPAARFVHLHRNGPDCALSMSRHVGYRVIRAIRDAPGAEQRPAAALRAHADMSPVRFGTLWSELITEGVGHLGEVPGAQRSVLAYEDLLNDPAGELTRLAAFLGVPAPRDWLAAARTHLDPTRRGAAGRLPPAELTRLTESCTAGTRALAAAR